MGESAGGGLTARMALYNKDKGDKIPVKGEVLIYPMLDYRTGGKDDIYNNEYAGDYIWSKEENVAGWADLKHGEDIPEDEMIYYSPAVAAPEQLAGLPDTFIIVGSLDLFVNEDLAYASNLTRAGVLAEAYLEPGVPHSYNVVGHDTPQGKRFVLLRDNAVQKMFGK
jgi:acetyl esterase/lipase